MLANPVQYGTTQHRCGHHALDIAKYTAYTNIQVIPCGMLYHIVVYSAVYWYLFLAKYALSLTEQ